MIDKFTNKYPDKFFGIASLGQLRYLSVLQYIDVVVGNSSSGLLEAPSFKIATINVGDRQKGRLKAKSVIDCLPNKLSIKKAIKKAYSKEFKKKLNNTMSPYEVRNIYASKKILNVLKNINLKNILKKKFYDY
jgi:GDP/UDP-N,N'-diacetylbacillosamine 2-epimerase (hydrolysing)